MELCGNFELDPVKIIVCKECGVEIPVNAKYPVEEVGCQPWYCPKLTDLYKD